MDTKVCPVPESPVGRIFYLDAARAVFMCSAVFIHMANVYGVKGAWLIHDPVSTASGMDTLSGFLHIFHSPAFMMISGYFCFLTYQKYGASGIWKRSMVRIVLPMLTAVLLLNPILRLLLSTWDPELPLPTSIDYWYHSQAMSHMWFLMNLAVYNLLFLGLSPWIAQFARYIVRLEARLPLDTERKKKLFWAFLIFTSMVMFADFVGLLGQLVPWIYEGYPFIGSMNKLLIYFPFFAFGAMLRAEENIYQGFYRSGWYMLPLLAVLYIGLYSLGEAGVEGPLLSTFELATEAGLEIVLVFLVMTLLKFLFVTETKGWRKIADAAYTTYLFNHLLVISVALILMGVDINPVVKYLGASFFIILCTVTIHHGLIERSPLLLYIMNGRKTKVNPPSDYKAQAPTSTANT
jgi:glucan biosynthesis protein C